MVDVHVLGTKILDQSKIDYHSSRSEGTRFRVKASTKFAANLCGYLLVIQYKNMVWQLNQASVTESGGDVI